MYFFGVILVIFREKKLVSSGHVLFLLEIELEDFCTVNRVWYSLNDIVRIHPCYVRIRKGARYVIQSCTTILNN